MTSDLPKIDPKVPMPEVREPAGTSLLRADLALPTTEQLRRAVEVLGPLTADKLWASEVIRRAASGDDARAPCEALEACRSYPTTDALDEARCDGALIGHMHRSEELAAAKRELAALTEFNDAALARQRALEAEINQLRLARTQAAAKHPQPDASRGEDGKLRLSIHMDDNAHCDLRPNTIYATVADAVGDVVMSADLEFTLRAIRDRGYDVEGVTVWREESRRPGGKGKFHTITEVAVACDAEPAAKPEQLSAGVEQQKPAPIPPHLGMEWIKAASDARCLDHGAPLVRVLTHRAAFECGCEHWFGTPDANGES